MIVFRKLTDKLVGQINGKPFNLPRTDENEITLEKMRDGVLECSMDKIKELQASSIGMEIEQECKYLSYKPATKEYFLTIDGRRFKKALSPLLVALIEDTFEKNLDLLPIVKAIARLLSNVRYSSVMGDYFANYITTEYIDHTEVERLMEEENYTREAATSLATYDDLAITQEGLLATYKVVDICNTYFVQEFNEDGELVTVEKQKYEKGPDTINSETGEVIEEGQLQLPEFKEYLDFKPAICTSGHDFYCGEKLGYKYKVGRQALLPKEAPRNLDNTFGGGGLYTGGLRYIDGYSRPSNETLTCFVNPADIISFQDEGNAMRVDAMFPNNVWDIDIPLKGKFHSSEYDKMSTERLEDTLKAIIDEKRAKLEQELKDLEA